MIIAKCHFQKSEKNLNNLLIQLCGSTYLTVKKEKIEIFAPLIASQNLIANDIINNNKELEDEVTVDGCKEFINYLSYSEVDINEKNVADVIVASWYFKELDLFEKSKQYFLKIQSPNTILHLLNSENEKFISRFKSILDNYDFNPIIANNIIILLEETNIREMKLSTFLYILQQNEIIIPNEDYLIEKILLFISYHQETLPKVTELLLNYVDWNKTSTTFEDYIKKKQINLESNQQINYSKVLTHRLLNYPIDLNDNNECIMVLDNVIKKYENYEYHNITEYEENILLNIPLEMLLLCDNEDCNKLVKNPETIHKFFESKNKDKICLIVDMIERMYKESNYQIAWLRKYILYFLSCGLKLTYGNIYKEQFKWIEIKENRKISIKLDCYTIKDFNKDECNLCLIKEMNSFTVDKSINRESKDFIDICKNLYSIECIDKLIIKNNPINVYDFEEMSNYFSNSLNTLTLEAINNPKNPLSQSKHFFSERIVLNNLKNLNLSNNSLGYEGLSSFSCCLTKFPNLEQLTLNNNIIDARGIHSLAYNFSCITNLQKLFLAYNKIDKMGCDYIINNLKYITKLNQLNLYKNDIQCDSNLLNEFSQYNNIKKLYLQNNTVSEDLTELRNTKGMNTIYFDEDERNDNETIHTFSINIASQPDKKSTIINMDGLEERDDDDFNGIEIDLENINDSTNQLVKKPHTSKPSTPSPPSSPPPSGDGGDGSDKPSSNPVIVSPLIPNMEKESDNNDSTNQLITEY